MQRAVKFATQAHRRIDQRRKYSKQPYEVHLKSVADIVASVTDDEEMLAAAWLHDTVEDTPATIEDIEREFGEGVAGLVSDLTDVSRPGDGNRAVRKAIDRAHSARASARAKTVKLADLIDNCRDICSHDERFARVFLVEMAALLEVLDDGDPRLLRRARRSDDQPPHRHPRSGHRCHRCHLDRSSVPPSLLFEKLECDIREPFGVAAVNRYVTAVRNHP